MKHTTHRHPKKAPPTLRRHLVTLALGLSFAGLLYVGGKAWADGDFDPAPTYDPCAESSLQSLCGASFPCRLSQCPHGPTVKAPRGVSFSVRY